MLCLSRHRNEDIVIYGPAVVRVIGIRGDVVRLGIIAERHVKILRAELPQHDQGTDRDDRAKPA